MILKQFYVNFYGNMYFEHMYCVNKIKNKHSKLKHNILMVFVFLPNTACQQSPCGVCCVPWRELIMYFSLQAPLQGCTSNDCGIFIVLFLKYFCRYNTFIQDRSQDYFHRVTRSANEEKLFK